MIYQISVAVPANTTQDAPVERSIPVVVGQLERVWLGFPRGCSGLLHAQLWRAGTILIPFKSDESIAWDNIVFDMPMHDMILAEPRRLTLRCWNLDDSYAHRVFCMVSVLPLAQWYVEHPDYRPLTSIAVDWEV